MGGLLGRGQECPQMSTDVHSDAECKSGWFFVIYIMLSETGLYMIIPYYTCIPYTPNPLVKSGHILDYTRLYSSSLSQNWTINCGPTRQPLSPSPNSKVAETLADAPGVLGLNIINEPFPGNFYEEIWQNVQNVALLTLLHTVEKYPGNHWKPVDKRYRRYADILSKFVVGYLWRKPKECKSRAKAVWN